MPFPSTVSYSCILATISSDQQMEGFLAMSDFVLILRSPDPGWHNTWKIQIKVLRNNSRNYIAGDNQVKMKYTVPGSEERL